MRGDRLKWAIEHKGLKNKDVAAYMNVSPAAVSRWGTEINEPDDDVKCRLADFLGVSVGFLMGDDAPPEFYGGKPLPGGMVSVPVLTKASIACAGFGNGGIDGIIAEAEEFIPMGRSDVGIISIDSDKQPFLIEITGNSMEAANIADGARVLVNPAEEVNDGDVALVCFGIKNEIAVKWVYFDRRTGSVEIRSASPLYPPRVFTKEDVDNGFFCIVGKVMHSMVKPRRGE